MLYHIYSGDLFFSSLSLLVVVMAIELVRSSARRPLVGSVVRVSALLAVALAAFSATPVPLWQVIPGGLAVLAFLSAPRGARAVRVTAAAATIALSLLALAWEAGYRVGERAWPRPVRMIVLGDSLSSGGFGEGRTWPRLVADAAGAALVDFSRAGDTVPAAVDDQLPAVPGAAPGDLVFVELGGNDMLEGTGARAFERGLETLSGTLAREDRRVVMFELPLLPGRWAYGAAQRRVARRHGIVLIPKRTLARVLLDPENTSDGLHLTQAGHQALAQAVIDRAGW
jgi:acyl-CoA thioesterase-1